LVVFSQNHDQVGNRMAGERPGEHLSKPQLKLAAATVLLSPYLPLLFMGEEYAETAPFPYFVSHGDAELVEAIRQGRLKEFAAYDSQGSPPDPQDETTFLSAKLNQEQRRQGDHRIIFDFYCELIRLRKEYAPLVWLSREDMQIVACEEERVLAVIRGVENFQLLCLFNYSDQTRLLSPALVNGTLKVLLDSTGSLTPGSSVTVFATRPETFPTLAPFGVLVYGALKTG
jgi:maltooligosyltrehalose trehalohydrolase